MRQEHGRRMRQEQKHGAASKSLECKGGEYRTVALLVAGKKKVGSRCDSSGLSRTAWPVRDPRHLRPCPASLAV